MRRSTENAAGGGKAVDTVRIRQKIVTDLIDEGRGMVSIAGSSAIWGRGKGGGGGTVCFLRCCVLCCSLVVLRW